jgi:regulator of protease activity HflC (stomatin/prohibitin superfamily)
MADKADGLLRCLVVGAIGVVCLGIGGCMWGYPRYRVYEQEMVGKAKLAEAESSKLVAVQDAKAKLESSKMLAQAEVERAKGVAEANRIIGQSLENNEAYLHYLWIHNLELGNNEVIYIPTETGLPIFEAGGRFHRTRKPKPEAGAPGTTEHPDATTEHRGKSSGNRD